MEQGGIALKKGSREEDEKNDEGRVRGVAAVRLDGAGGWLKRVE